MKLALKMFLVVVYGIMAQYVLCAAPARNVFKLYNFTSHPLYAAYYYDMNTRYERPNDQPNNIREYSSINKYLGDEDKQSAEKIETGPIFKAKVGKSVDTIKIPRKSTLFSKYQRNLVVTNDKKLLTSQINLIDNEDITDENPHKYRLPDGLYKVHVSDKETKTVICQENMRSIYCIFCGGENLNDSRSTPCGKILDKLRVNAALKKQYQSRTRGNSSTNRSTQGNSSATPSRGSFRDSKN